MHKAVRLYLAKIGSRGGRTSKRRLGSDAARAMVKLREARRGFRQFHPQCFWSTDPDYLVTAADVAWVAERLMTHGGRRGWEIGARLCR